MRCKINYDVMYREWFICVEGNPVSVFSGTYNQCLDYVKNNRLKIDYTLTW